MKKIGTMTLMMALAVLIISVNAYSGKKDEVFKTFNDIDRIVINTTSGDCIVNKGEGKEVSLEVINAFRPRDSFEPKIRERGGTLRLTEELFGSNSGNSTWTLTVPDGIEIEFSTASGELTINDLDGFFAATTASGDIEIENCSGLFEFSTASGDIVVDDCKGEFLLSTASGSVDAVNVTLTEESSFSTASGRVDVILAQSTEYDLNIGSASGSAVLDYGGNPIKGMFEFEARKRKGKIVCPIDFDDEKTYRKWDQTYVRKIFTKGAETPVITIGTASGRAVLKEG